MSSTTSGVAIPPKTEEPPKAETPPSGVTKSQETSCLYKDMTPLAALAAWISNPLPQVGTTTAALTNIQVCADYASRVGCKSQSYTSWDSHSRSYAVRIVYAGLENVAQGGRPELAPGLDPL